MRRTLHETMTEEGARILLAGLYEKGIMPHSYLRREAEALRVCQDVQREWLQEEIASPLFATLLWEAVWRLRARERDRQ
ncbi:MAG: hypothetical protein JWN14_4387 [Chthonomonadales bacterium]|nr:hypothetical protein [Chthonomonadales bacterium]